MKKNFDFKKLMLGAMVLLLALSLAAPLNAQEKYPNDTISIVTGFAAGGGSDLVLRMLAKEMQKDLKVPVVVENKPGGGGVLGWSLVQAAKPDGYTTAFLSSSLILETFNTKGRVHYNKFDPIVMLYSAPVVVVVPKDAPYNTIDEFLQYAKAHPLKVRVGNSGVGAFSHIVALIIEKTVGVKFTHVPFKSGSECGPALLGKHIEASVSSPGDLIASLETGNLRILAISSEKRDPYFPDVQTLKEKGINVVMEVWRGVGVLKGTPKERIAILEKAFLKAMQQPDYLGLLEKLKITNNFRDGTEFRKIYLNDAEVLSPILKSLEK